jgi:SAM-dependent methyltransferase
VAHEEQIEFFSRVFEMFPEVFRGKVIDIGSYDINGGPHELISPTEYVGVDLAPGPNVTLVSGGQDVSLPTCYFDAAISSECFEHNPYWIATFQNMIRMTKSGGVVAFSTGSIGRERHGTSDSDGGYAAPAAISSGQEFYRNVSKRSVKAAFEESQFSSFWMGYHPVTADLYFVGIKSFKFNDSRLNPVDPLAQLGEWHRRAIVQSLRRVASPTGAYILLTRIGLGNLAKYLVRFWHRLRPPD